MAWAGWRLARSGYWSEVLNERRNVHVRYWDELAQRRREDDILYVAIGDSTAQGIGAREPSGSYVGQLERLLAPRRLQVVNLSISGARLSDVISALLPKLAALDTADALVTFAAGANDVPGLDPVRFRRELNVILDALPEHALIAEIPSFYVRPYQANVKQANAILHELADQRNRQVIPLFNVTNRYGPTALASHHAKDVFHPNDRGYRLWTRAFLGPASARLDAVDAGAGPRGPAPAPGG